MPSKPRYTFLTGAPGSRWSGIGQLITDNFNYNKSDENSDRVYTHGEFSGHRGSYFGPEMENGNDFHRLAESYFDRHRFEAMCNSPFSEPDTNNPKMIKCHQFAYGLDWLKDNIPNSQILLIKRDSGESFDWWKKAGGWNITYPKYDWYMNDETMRSRIQTEIRLANDFVNKNAKWSQFNEEWLTNNFGTNSIKDIINKDDVEVCLIRTNG
tara:strand:+ start:370 stop:1002 length:633 start_codon:yes stop_codon:yes gene_type:complete